MEINYKPDLPKTNIPIVIIGAGGIVRDAHLPAYRKAGFQVFGIVNRTEVKARVLAEAYGVERVYTEFARAVEEAPESVVYDLALMPAQYAAVLEALPEGAFVLIQKPMGDSLQEAKEIIRICEKKKITAAINCQLRFAPFVSAARDMIQQGLIGQIYDMEVRLTTYTPWEIFPLVAVHDRLEIAYHSVHYIDLIRSFLGEPQSIMAKSFNHPEKDFASTRTTMIFNYGKRLRAVIHTNHDHDFGPDNQESFIKWEGTKGVIKAKMGLLLDYPNGVPDKFEYCLKEKGKEPVWQQEQLEGSWFPDAFIGTMASLMRYAEGSSTELPTDVHDVIHTMELVEAAFKSDAEGGIKIK